MKHLADHARTLVRLISSDSLALSVLAAVVVICVFAFGFGSDHELVGGLLILGLMTAVAEARWHAKNRKE